MCTHKKCNSMPRAHSSFIIHECISEHKHSAAIWLWNCEPSTHTAGELSALVVCLMPELSAIKLIQIFIVSMVCVMCVCERARQLAVSASASKHQQRMGELSVCISLLLLSLSRLSVYSAQCKPFTVFVVGRSATLHRLCVYLFEERKKKTQLVSLFLHFSFFAFGTYVCVCVYLRSSQVWRVALYCVLTMT